MEIKIQDLMLSSGVKFGTSGARGLADDMTDFVCYVYTRGFLQYLESAGEIRKGRTEVAVAGDFRPSTDRILRTIEDGKGPQQDAFIRYGIQIVELRLIPY